MCVIIGVVSQYDVSKILVDGLRRLEYRGYDSAGIALIDFKGHLIRIRKQGKVNDLAKAVQEAALVGKIGIAHTRWATHGKPCEENAHPHLSYKIALVHNGIIENHEKLRNKLLDLGYKFLSETDTEVAAHLIHYHCQHPKNLLSAVQDAAREMEGASALVVIDERQPEEIIAIRIGCPLVVGLGDNEQFIASDIVAFSAKSAIYLEEGDSVRLYGGSFALFDANGQPVERQIHSLAQDSYVVSKGPYRHFMLKEISEQAEVLADTLEGRVTSLKVLRASFGQSASSLFHQIKQIHIVACGTSYHAGLVARYWLESLAFLPTSVEIASEYRYRDVVVNENTLFITVSQSGETADTLGALRKARSLNYLSTLAICNVARSSLVREADCVFLTHAGVEIGVASTKAFTTQLAAFLMLAAALCEDERASKVLAQLKELPLSCQEVLKMGKKIQEVAAILIHKTNALFLGRGVQYPVALEGALKLKEISYIHAEAYPAGELKHGPLALVDKNMPIIAIAPNDELLDKLKSNLQEVSAREGQLIVFVDDAQPWIEDGAQLIRIPSCGQWIAPIIYTIPLQLLAYYVAVAKGTDVDQPRNLAKSVTVE